MKNKIQLIIFITTILAFASSAFIALVAINQPVAGVVLLAIVAVLLLSGIFNSYTPIKIDEDEKEYD